MRIEKSSRQASDRKLIVLAGAGYANIEILRHDIRNPYPHCDFLLITPRPTKIMRALLPWVISGEILRQNAELDLLQLCKAAGAQMVLGEIERVDLLQNCVVMLNGSQIYFDYLSLSLGSEIKTPLQGPQVVAGNRLEYLLETIENIVSKNDKPKIAIYGDSPLARILIRGFGRLRTPVELTLLTEQESYPKGLVSFEKFKMNSLLKSLQARIICSKKPEKNSNGKILLNDSETLDTDLLIMADEGRASPIFEKSAFAMEKDKVLVNDALQLSLSPRVFVAGPGVAVQGHIISFNPNRPSHRFGKVIAENLRRALEGKSLIVFRAEHSLASWLPALPDHLSLGWSRWRLGRWQGWLSRKNRKTSGSYMSSSAGELVRSDSRNTSLRLVTSQARLEGMEAHWIAQLIGRQIQHQSQLKRLDAPLAIKAHLNLDTNQSSKKLIRTKLSQVQAGLESLKCSLEVRVISAIDENLQVSTDLTFQPNLNMKSGDLIYVVGKLGSAQSLYSSFSEQPNGHAWFELRNQTNRDYEDFIAEGIRSGIVDGCTLDERGLIRNLEDLVVPNNLGVSLDLDRIPIHTVNNTLAIDPHSDQIQQNLEFSKYLPNEIESLTTHPRFLSLFGAEVSGLVLILPKDRARNISEDLNKKFPTIILTPIGALTDGPVRFQFRVTTR